jgi:glycosyltransferase involved in cell wall biosynthesis
MSERLRVFALATYPVEAAASRYRIVQFIDALAARGIDVTFAPFLDRELFDALYSPRKLALRSPRFALRLVRRLGDVLRASRADVVWIQREAMLFGPPVIERLVRALGRPVVLDLDDATYIASDSPVYGRLATALKWPSKTDRLIRWSSAVIAGSDTVAAYVEAAGARATIVPTIVDLNVFTPRESERTAPVIGWIGTHSTYEFLRPLLPLLSDLGREHDFSLRIVGSGRERIEIPYVRVETKRWQLEDEVRDFQSLDVGLYPLVDDPFTRGKSGFKAIQYMAVGVPFVMSPVGVGATIGVEGRTHFLARDLDEWRAHLTTLLRDAEVRRGMGRAGREHAEAQYGLDEHADRIANVLRSAAARFA